MKAVEISRYGGNDVLEIVDVAAPTAGSGEVVIDVRAASINPMDWKIRNGALDGKITLPFRMGIDVTGVITALGEGVTDFTVGDEVYGNAMVLAGGSGTFAEQAMAKASALAKKPRSLNAAEAAALGLAGVSAYQALVEHIKLAPEQKLLITGGAGGIGSMAIAIAKSLGARVTVTVRSAEDAAYVASRGADVVINVSEQRVQEFGNDYDAAFDLVGGEARAEAAAVLKKGGTIVSMVGGDDELAQRFGITVIGQQTHQEHDRLTKLAQWVDDTTTKPHVTTFPFNQVREAFAAAERGQIQGKAVLVI